MPQKKIAKKKSNKKLGIDPTLKPRVIKTTSPLTEEEQNENPLGRMKSTPALRIDTELPKGFKTADALTPEDDLKFEIEKLTTKLSCWLDKVEVNGRILHCLVDPLNRKLEISEHPLHD